MVNNVVSVLLNRKLSASTLRRRNGGTRLQLRSFLTAALGVGEWLTSRSSLFTSRKEPGTKR